MVQQANTITAVKNTRVTINGNTYELHIPKVKWSKKEPTSQTWQGGTPEAQYSDATPATDWMCEIDLGHDYQNPDSAYAFFREHAGETLEGFAWKPDAEGPYTATADIVAVSPNPGGDYGKHHQSTIKCPSTPPVDSYDDAAAPTLVAVTPASVSTAGGADIVLTGTSFSGVSDVKIAGVSVPFNVLNATYILVQDVPAHAAGAVAVAVTNATGTVTDADALTYA